MSLTDTAIRLAKAKEKPYKLFDGGGFTLLVNPNGSKWWRFRYQFDGKEKMLSLGTYPDVPLKLARERRDEARRQVARNSDPGAERKSGKATKANTFGSIALEWFDVQTSPPPDTDREPLAPVTVKKTKWITTVPTLRALKSASC